MTTRSRDSSHGEEPMMFPYLLELESEAELPTEETFEETFEETPNPPTESTTPITVTISAELVEHLNKTIESLQGQLNEARTDIMDLQQIAFQNDVRARQLELRLKNLENPKLPSTIHEAPIEEDTDTDSTPPPAKKTKTTPTNTVGTYKGKKPFCPLCTRHHEGACANPSSTRPCFKRGSTRHFKAKCPPKGTSLPCGLRPM